jgi:alcohol dehydrogenase, propanol-preferring
MSHSTCMRLHRPGEPLQLESRAVPVPAEHQVLLHVRACAVCRTDLHLVDGDLPDVRLPIIPGHEVVGEVIARGAGVDWPLGVRLGVPWLGHTCGTCQYCRAGQENLCDSALFTGYQLDGGYAEHMLADARYCFELPTTLDDQHAAPLLCAGLIGYRSLKMTCDAQRIGVYGFGAAAHIVTQVATWQGRQIFAFTREGDSDAQRFARRLGAVWAGHSTQAAPEPLDAAIIFAPVGSLVPAALRAVRKAGIVVCGGIHMSDIPQFPYAILWGERSLHSIANLSRSDAIEFLKIAPRAVREIHIEPMPLRDANMALQRLRTGQLTGAAVLIP